jgi:uncharacterized protein YceK
MKKLVLVIISLLMLGGCATQRLSDSEKSTIIEQYIAAENLEHRSSVSAFNMDSWTSLSDQYLILRTSPFKPYLVKLSSRCNDLDYGFTLVIDSRIPNNLSEGLDSVYSPENQMFKCYISRIYPLTRAQNKALISATTPTNKDKSIAKPTTDKKDEAVKPLESTDN